MIKVLVRHDDGSPALWLELVEQELIRDDGSRFTDYTGTLLCDDNTCIPFDPETEDIEDTVADWEKATR